MPTSGKIRVLIADDHDLVRAGIAALLKPERDIVVVGQADTGIEALEKTASLSPHIVLMDLTMPQLDGIEATKKILAKHPMVKVIVLTQHEHEEYVKRVVHAGAHGYLVKNSLAGDLIRAIRSVHKGERFFDPAVHKIMADVAARVQSGEITVRQPLTKREREILEHIAHGKTNQQTANVLNISVRTVEFHRANLSQKLGIHDTASLVKYAIQEKIISL